MCFYAASAAYEIGMKKDAKLTAHLPLPLLKNVGECVILHSSAPGNRMGEMFVHLAGQRVGRTACPPIFFTVFIISPFDEKVKCFVKIKQYLHPKFF